MEPIKRVGPPTPIAVRGTEFDLRVPLNAMPTAEWRRLFQEPSNWKEPCHPSRITVKDRALMFTSDEALVRLWIEQIDEWITAANQRRADRLELKTRPVDQGDAQRERAQRLQEATERYKDL